jgi:tetratricopeptide (TPR) repeat protein
MGRREKLEALLADEPDDVFLLYGLACELVKEGDHTAGLSRFEEIHRRFPDYVPAWFKHAQIVAEHGESDAARQIGQTGLETARRVGDLHAAGELAGFLELL